MSNSRTRIIYNTNKKKKAVPVPIIKSKQGRSGHLIAPVQSSKICDLILISVSKRNFKRPCSRSGTRTFFSHLTLLHIIHNTYKKKKSATRL